jgi:hypothetical protein
MEEWMDGETVWHTDTGICLALKRKVILTHALTWMNLEAILRQALVASYSGGRVQKAGGSKPALGK